MSSLSEIDLLRRQVAELARELAERDQVLQEPHHHLDSELRDLRAQSTQLRAIIAGTAEAIGEDFFPALVTHLTSVLNVQYAVIGEVRQDSARKQIHTIAVAAGGALVDNFEYDLLDTPCETALASSFACFERGVQALFPSFTWLRQLNVEGYCGVSIRSKGGAVIGVLMLMDSKPLGDGEWMRSVLTMVASRAAAELERMRAEHVLERSARRYKDLVNSINVVVWEVDTITTQFTFVSPQIEAMLGYSVEQWLSSSTFWIDHLHPEDRSWVPQYCYEETRKYRGHTFEYRMLAADGRIVWVRDVVSVLVEDGRPTKLRGILEDITARKQAEEQLRESELRFRTLVERIGDVFWISDPINRKLVYVSQTFADIWGRNPNDLYDHFETWLDGIHEDDRARVAKEFFENILAGTYDTEYRIRRPDGSIRWIRDRGKPLSIGTLGAGVAEDITERKQAEEALRLEEERLRFVTLATRDAIYDWDVRAKTVQRNDSYQAMFSPGEPTGAGSEWREVRLHPDDRQRIMEGVSRVFNEQISFWSDEYRFMKSDGTYASVVDRGYILYGEDGQPSRMIGAITDITERKRAEDQLLELNARLATISSHLELVREEEQKRLAHDLHDELGHLLTAGKLDVSFLEQLMRSRRKSDRLALAETMDRLCRTLDNATASVRKIARQARPGSLDQLGLVATLEALVGDVRDHAGIQARFTSVVDEERFVLGKALEVALYRVAQEALTNVVRHSGATLVDVRLREEHGRILLEIQDDGKGFDESQYDPDQSFGLRGMKERLEMVGGRFSIIGCQGCGTVVTVTVNVPVGMSCQTS